MATPVTLERVHDLQGFDMKALATVNAQGTVLPGVKLAGRLLTPAQARALATHIANVCTSAEELAQAASRIFQER